MFNLKIKPLILMVTFLTVVLSLAVSPAVYAAYTSFYIDYAAEHDIRDTSKTTYTFSEKKKNPGRDFRVFVPPGATTLSMTIFLSQTAEYGVAVRGNTSPKCTYNLTVDDMDNLPWDRPGTASLSGIRSNDSQFKNIDGGILIFNGGTSAPSSGQWVYVKGLSYDGSSVAEMLFTVKVNVATFNSWYNQRFPNGTGNPPSLSGSSGGTCEDAWSEGCTGNCGGGSSGGGSSGGGTVPTFQFPIGGSGGGTSNPTDPNADNTKPTGFMDSPKNDDIVVGNLELRLVAKDNKEVSKVEYYIDTDAAVAVNGVLSSGDKTDGTWVGNFDTTTINDGTHNIWAKVTDASSNYIYTSVTKVIVNNAGKNYAQEFEIGPPTEEGFPFYHVAVTGNTVKIAPTLLLAEPMEGTYKVLAAYVKDGNLWIADQSIAGETEFWPFRDQLLFCGEITLTADQTQIGCSSFDNLPSLNLNILHKQNAHFFILLQNKADENDLYGVVFVFD
jgi:hypothetical protein